MQRKVKIYPSQLVPRIDALHEREVPFRSYEALVTRIRTAIPDEAEEKTCVIVHGSDGPEAWYQHTLSELEVAQASLEEAEKVWAGVRSILPQPGNPLSAEDVDRIRKLVS